MAVGSRLSVSSIEGVGPPYIGTGGHLASGSWAVTDPWDRAEEG
jgi:hypothetical protein